MVSGLVAISICIKSICPMPLLLFEIMASDLFSKSFRAYFVVSEILALFSGSFLHTCMLLGITKEDTS